MELFFDNLADRDLSGSQEQHLDEITEMLHFCQQTVYTTYRHSTGRTIATSDAMSTAVAMKAKYKTVSDLLKTQDAEEEQDDKTMDMAKDSYSNFLKLKGAQEKWRKSLLKTKVKEYDRRETEEADNVLTIDELTSVFESELACKCPTQLLSEDEFGLAPICTDEPLVLRNYLVVCILIENCARASIIAGMTLPEWEKRSYIDNQVVIKVHDHKTAASCGPIACILTLLTDRLLEAYINKIRVHNQGAYVHKQVSLISGTLSTIMSSKSSIPIAPSSTSTHCTQVKSESTLLTSSQPQRKSYFGATSKYAWSPYHTECLSRFFRTEIHAYKWVGRARIVMKFMEADNADIQDIWNTSNDDAWRQRCVEKIKNLYKSNQNRLFSRLRITSIRIRPLALHHPFRCHLCMLCLT
jgi:hypothetical protein